MTAPLILIHPGWGDSVPEHWQMRWMKKFPNAVKVVQKDWLNANKDEWVATLNEQIEAARLPRFGGGIPHPARPILFVGHSLACVTLAHWVRRHATPENPILHGALLVSASDPEQPDWPDQIQGFAPMPLDPLPFKTIVVASTDDPYVTLARAAQFAAAWGARLVNIGARGHINASSGLGEWEEGQRWLHSLDNPTSPT